jgi:ribosomal protein S10
MGRTYRITLKTFDGVTLYTGLLLAEEIVEIGPKVNAAVNGPAAADPAERMTDPQRRYLFRLLASRGLDGKQTEEHLRDHFHVTRLADISRPAASEYIDRLIKGQPDATA